MTTKDMYGIEIPKVYRDAVRPDKISGDTQWQDCTFLEMGQLTDYRTFEEIGLAAPTLQGYRCIRVHLVYAVKHNERRQAHLVADGHLTDLPLDSVYFGVISLKGLRSMIFTAKLNQLPIGNTNIGNTYLKAKTQEKVWSSSSPGSHTDHHQGIGGLRWHEKFADCLPN
jgi:hypothetical protein